MQLKELGSAVESEWLRTPAVRPNVDLDLFVVMPNHFHAILLISGDGVGATGSVAPAFKITSGSLGAIMAQFKRESTVKVNRLRDKAGAKLWQRSYHDRTIRNERELNALRDYILNNPSQWKPDDFYG